MRTLSNALHRSFPTYAGMGDAGGLRGDTHAGQASGGYSGGRSGGDHGTSAADIEAARQASIKSAAAARATEAASKAASAKAESDRQATATATQVRALEAAAAKAATVKAIESTTAKEAIATAATTKAVTDRAGEVAQRAFNQAIAAGSLTPAGVVAYQEAQKTIPGSTWLGSIFSGIAKFFSAPVVMSAGVLAPVAGMALSSGINATAAKINASMSQAAWEKAAAEALGPDWGGSGSALEQSDYSPSVSDRLRYGGTSNITTRDQTHSTGAKLRTGISVTPVKTAALPGSSGNSLVSVVPSSSNIISTANVQPATDHGGLILGAGILAAKLLL